MAKNAFDVDESFESTEETTSSKPGRQVSPETKEQLERALDAFSIEDFNKKEARELRKAIQLAVQEKYPKKKKAKNEKKEVKKAPAKKVAKK